MQKVLIDLFVVPKNSQGVCALLEAESLRDDGQKK
jgi:hypothetical protein